MKHRDFFIGMEFFYFDKRYRVTDKGTRTVLAIRVDEVEITHPSGPTLQTVGRTIYTKHEAQALNYFSGPIYGLTERVFDEESMMHAHAIWAKMFLDTDD